VRRTAMAETESRPSTVTVLCCVAEHRRQVDFTPEEAQTHLKCLVEAVKSVFSDVIAPTSELILQLKSEIWKGEFVDIRETDTITNEAVVRAIVKEEPRKVRYSY
jgi:hypothetical protein